MPLGDRTETLATRNSARIVGRLKLYFATLSCLGGLVLSAGSETETIPVIAVFFAVFGYVFVDWLKLFALPPIAAYAAMALAALYCVSDFANLDAPGNHQMVAVAQLLVFVQAILMLQRKSRRIFEQLGVFCLLELVVAAVFNNAINYGLLLVPIGVIGAWAATLLAALSASEGLEVFDELEDDDESVHFFRRPRAASSISVSAPESVKSLTSTALSLPRIAFFSLAPSVVLVGAIFFYALPRTTDAARVRNRGNALVGFSDELRLEQIGEMLQNTQPALRVYPTDDSTGQQYQILGGVYLRGRVLEIYRKQTVGDRNTAVWTSIPPGAISGSQKVPKQFIPSRSTDQNFYDHVNVAMICESMRSGSLFAVAPYHRIKNDPEIRHFVDRWTIARSSDEDWIFPRIDYAFGTHAFRNGVQSELTARWAEGESAMSPSADNRAGGSRFNSERDPRGYPRSDYLDALLAYDIDEIPSAARLGELFVLDSNSARRSDYKIAKAMEQFLAGGGEYSYTLRLDAESVPGLDPIEQFLSVDKRGHCQYYASALAMMLRSQNIPARIVAGYHTDEYNELGEHYVARQLHAHAWVEALIDREELGEAQRVYGQPESRQYWLRLDPTPIGARLTDSGGTVTQMFDMAQNMWDDYVVDMDAGRQDNALLGGGIAPMSRSYEKLVDYLSLAISRVRAGELGGGYLASRDSFSWPAAILGVVMTLVFVMLLRFRAPAWIRRQIRRHSADAVARPQIPFYAETLDQLARTGIQRKQAQTPAELATHASEKLEHPMIPSIAAPLSVLTSAFYRLRFGKAASGRSRLEMNSPVEHARQRSSEVDLALAELTHSVDLMMVNSNGKDRTS